MNCHHCKLPFGRREPMERIEAGTRLTDGMVVAREVNLHPDCLGAYFLLHYPWLVKPRPLESQH